MSDDQAIDHLLISQVGRLQVRGPVLRVGSDMSGLPIAFGPNGAGPSAVSGPTHIESIQHIKDQNALALEPELCTELGPGSSVDSQADCFLLIPF